MSQYSTKIDTTRVPAEAKKKADRVAREIELRLSRGGGPAEAKRRMICNEIFDLHTVFTTYFPESNRIIYKIIFRYLQDIKSYIMIHHPFYIFMI